MHDRREALKIIGAIGTTCAFPFSSGELYGQHVHPAPGPAAGYNAPQFFTQDEYARLSRLADVIIPATDTPGASGAGVPAYVDFVVNSNETWRTLFREGLAWLGDKGFDTMTEAQQIALLTPLCDSADDGKLETMQAKFFAAAKGMTADGYYTSRIGMTKELGFAGSEVMSSFPGCSVPEH